MLSILICHSYYLQFDRKQLELAKPYPPLATLQAAALVRQAGHQVQLFDAMLASGVEDFALQLSRATPDLVLIYEDNFNFLSKMCLAQMRHACFAMIHLARQRGARVIAAGADVSGAPGEYLAAGADVVLLGEGLATLLALLPRMDEATWRAPTHTLLDGLTDVAFQRDGQMQVLRTQALLPEAALPALPAWDLVAIERYRDVWRRAHGHFSLNMTASRGCSFRCSWCAKPIWGNRYLQRSAADVAAEMAYLKRSFAPDHIWFADDIFGFKAEWVMEFAQRAAQEDGLIPFTIQTRADLVSERMAQALRHALCHQAWLGAESGSERVLQAMNKGTTVANIRAARARLREAGVRTGFFIQLGYPEERLADILATRALVEETLPETIGVSVAYPLPGTRFYEEVREQLGPKRHWHDSGDLDVMFWGAYSSGFYRKVRDLLHEQVSLAGLPPARQPRAARALRQRWQTLLAREASQRNPAHGHPEPTQPAAL